MGEDVRITLLGGVNEVGGNIVFLEDFGYGVKIFLDFGVNIENFKGNYREGRHPSSIKELMNLSIIPNEDHLSIENLYTKQIGTQPKNLVDEDFPSNLDAIFISHPHKYFHYYSISFIKILMFRFIF